MTELILIRHGETIWNEQGRWQGHLDSDLTATGLQQAEALAERLATVRFDALYSSDLGRAWRTAERIASRTGRAVIAEPGLRERGLGVLQGLTYAEIEEQYPAEFKHFKAREPDHVIPAGESIRGKHERAVACIEAIVARHPGQRVVAVTHGGVLDSAFRHAAGLTLLVPRRWVLYNASLNTFLREDDRWMIGTWGDVGHLRKVGTLDDY
jgi:probable phosphoglycerate mutase